MHILSEQFSVWAIPGLIFIILVVGVVRRVPVYETFVEGAAEGFQTAIRIMPYLIAMMVSINIFRFSGAFAACVNVIQPFLLHVGIPTDLVPLAIMRSLSGSGSLGIVSELFHTYGPDSLVGRIASTILASTDTTFYVLTVYFGAVGIRNARYAPFVGLCGDAAGFITSIYLCRLLFE